MNIKIPLYACGLAAAISVNAAISYTPVTEGATEGAKKLYNFMAVNYGVKTISGIMTGDVNSSEVKKLADGDSFYVRTGKYPALVGFDYLFATGKEASIKIKDVTIEESSGDGMMAVTYGANNAQIEYQKTFDLSGATELTFEAKNNGKSAAQLNLIFKI